MENTLMTTASSGPGIGFPQVSYLKELQQRSDLRETSFAIDFPLLTDPEVRRLSGNKGSPFGQAIHKRMFWDAANNKLLVHHALLLLLSCLASWVWC
jgi:hypothetical protein